MTRFFQALLLCIIVLPGCGPTVVYDKKVTFQNAWVYDNIQRFSFEITDTIPAYDLILHLEHDKDFAYQNVYTKVVTQFPNAKKAEHVISLNLTDERTRWVGNCNGTTCTAPLILSENIYFNLPGKYQISLEQYGRKDSLTGLRSFQFTVVERKKS